MAQKRKKPSRDYTNQEHRNTPPKKIEKKSRPASVEITSGPVRLNKYIASAGVCSRRDADVLITQGKIQVNGQVTTTLGFKVNPGDKVTYGEKELNPQSLVYVLLNKPKDFITTTDDPQNRRTVMDLVKSASDERIFPVGRLDRMTTGLLLMTNDGDLAKKLSHPSHKIKKIYHVTIDKPLLNNDLIQIQEGLELEDGPVNVDEIVILSNDKKEIGLEIHVGKNRIVRRIFEHLNYRIKKLDRVSYASLSKKDIPRGKWRLLSEKEIVRLKHF